MFQMKRESKLLLRIIFLLAVLFCPVIHVYSNNNIQVTVVKHPAVDNCEENNSSLDVDFFDDEQISQISEYFSCAGFVFQIHIPQDCLLIPRFPNLIWQPPKNM